MEELSKIFKEQKEFQKNFFDPDNLTDDDRIKLTKENILSIHNELSEVLNTIPWKLHRKSKGIPSLSNIHEEVVDTFKFLLNICIIWGMDEKKLVEEFFRKSNVVKQRYNQEILSDIKTEEKVCAIDLDDTLCDHSAHFVKVFNDKYGTDHKRKKDIKANLSILDYENFKTYFRESGEKRYIPAKPGAKEITEYLKSLGYKIVIISARPYEKHNRIFPDTLEWLSTNEIKFDALFFSERKHLEILSECPQLSFIIEDDPDYSRQISDSGYKVYMLQNQKEGISCIEAERVVCINDLSEIKDYEK